MSYRKRYLFISGAMIILIMLAFLIFGRSITGQFFIKRKLSSMKDAYKKLNEASKFGDFNSEEFNLSFKKICENNNIKIVLVDSESDTIKASDSDYEFMSRQLLAYLFENIDESSTTLIKGDRYEAYLAKDPRTDIEYIDMWGVLGDGTLFLFRSPLGGIEQTAKLTNNLLAFIFITIVLIILIILLIISRRVTVSELREDNLRLQKDIEEKEKTENMRKEFLDSVSHELKTPIALIQGYAEGLKESVNKDEESKDFYCDVIMDEASKMNSLVKKVLDLNHLEFGDVELTYETLDLVELIKNHLASFDVLCKQKGAELSFESPDEVMVRADEYYTEEILNNYLSNALNHVSGQMQVKITVEVADNKAKVSVFNTGDPIPEESLPRIWEKFYKVDKARTREYGGNGVGLSIVKAIAEKTGQEYGAYNYETGVGFFFTLDLA